MILPPSSYMLEEENTSIIAEQYIRQWQYLGRDQISKK